MKKTVVLLLFVLSIFTLAGCQEEREEVTDKVAPVISGTKDFTLDLDDLTPNWLDDVTATDDVDQDVTITVDDSDVNLDEAGVYDLVYIATDSSGNESKITVKVIIEDPNAYTFFVKLINYEGETLIYESILYDPDLDVSTIELIEDVVELDYKVSDYGTMINGVGGYYPKEYGASYNYFYELQIDGVSSTTGIDLVEYDQGMVISFVETTFLSELDKMVDDYIYTFINNQIDTYITSETVDHSVLAAVYQLYSKGYITLDPTTLYEYSNLTLSSLELSDLSISDLLKLGVYMSVEDMDMTLYKTHLETVTPTNAYALTSYLTALNMVDEKNEDFAADLIAESFLDADFVGMSYSALYNYQDLLDYQTYQENANLYLESMLSIDGISSWGNANSASTATVIMGLVAQGINPEDEAFSTNDVGLIEALMSYEHNGGFKWLLTDENADLMFSTPQAFSALVAYKLARDIYGFPATSLFDLNQ